MQTEFIVHVLKFTSLFFLNPKNDLSSFLVREVYFWIVILNSSNVLCDPYSFIINVESTQVKPFQVHKFLD